MPRFLLALVALLLTSAAAMALDGVYGENCAGEFEDVPLEIRGDRIVFYESSCALTNPVNVRDMAGAVLFDMQCDGEGQTWTERLFLQPSHDGGLIFVSRGFARMLPRCD